MEPAKHLVTNRATDLYGDLPMIQSTDHTRLGFTPFSAINDSLVGKKILVRARVHACTAKGSLAFLVLRQGHYTIQAAAFKSDAITKEMLHFIGGVSKESIVDVEAEVKKVEKEVKKCSIYQFELGILRFLVVNRSHNVLPFQLEDASRKVENKNDEFAEEQEKDAAAKPAQAKGAKPEDKKEEKGKKEGEAAPKEAKDKKKGEGASSSTGEAKKEAHPADGAKAEEKHEAKEPAKEEKAHEEGKPKAEGGEKKGKEKKEKPKKDAEHKEGEAKEEPKQPIVKLKTRLNARVIDFRTPSNQAIFRIQSAVCRFFRDYLHAQDFIEIHTPKLLGGSSEGGANVFRFDYFSKPGCLAQSPQLYKQMMVMGDFTRVFEIGPVFRAENSMTHRHLCEFTGLDIEMAIEQSYYEVMDVIGGLFTRIFKGLEGEMASEVKAVKDQYDFEPFLYLEKPLILTFEEGVKMLHEAKVDQSVHEDLTTETERVLGKLVREKYKTDFYILHRYPQGARPFYTMLCKDDPEFTCSYDVFMRGEEIISGAQRIHDPELLAERAKFKKIPVNTIQDYIDAFKYGAYPHGGFGVGLERVVMLYLDLGNIRKSSAFPRDPSRITP